jgi:hypothetical protein
LKRILSKKELELRKIKDAGAIERQRVQMA